MVAVGKETIIFKNNWMKLWKDKNGLQWSEENVFYNLKLYLRWMHSLLKFSRAEMI